MCTAQWLVRACVAPPTLRAQNELVSGDDGGPWTFFFLVFRLLLSGVVPFFPPPSESDRTHEKEREKNHSNRRYDGGEGRTAETEPSNDARGTRVGRIWKFVRTPKICRARSLITLLCPSDNGAVVTGGIPDLLLLLISRNACDRARVWRARVPYMMYEEWMIL